MSLIYRKFINGEDTKCFVYNDNTPDEIRMLNTNKLHWEPTTKMYMNEIEMNTPDDILEQEDPSVWEDWLAGN